MNNPLGSRKLFSIYVKTPRVFDVLDKLDCNDAIKTLRGNGLQFAYLAFIEKIDLAMELEILGTNIDVSVPK